MNKFLLLFLFPTWLFAQKLDYDIMIVNGQSADLQLLKDGNTTTGWFPGWNSGDYPVRALIQLKEKIYIQKIRVYDWVGKPNLKVYSDNKKIVDRDLGLYGQWQEWEVNSELTDELIIQISDIQGDRPITEFEIYGTTTKPPPVPLPIKKVYGDALKIGVNGFHWVSTELNPTPNLRMYQMSQWTWTPTGIMVEPTFQANGMYDSYLSMNRDKTVVFCINTVPDWFSSKPQSRFHREGLISTSPQSYKEFGEYVWQIVARYGSKTYPSNLLKVNKTPRWNNDQINTEKSGLNLIKYIEFENETDRPWNDPTLKYTPQECAAMMSVLWDGHEGSLGNYVGVKNADPKIKLVLPGLSAINLWYLSEMKHWFEQHRKDKRFCADVINVHHYSNSKNPWPGSTVDLTGTGVSPDQDHLDYRLNELKLWCIQNTPKAEIWFSEFGYDTYPPSTVLSQYSTQQGQWLLRTYLISLSCEMDKIFMFNLCDEDSFDKGYCFGSSGLLTSESTSFKKKQSWNDLDWLVRELNNYSFYKVRSTNGITIFEFRNKLMSKFFYWSEQEKSFQIGSKKLVSIPKISIYTSTRLFNNTVVKEIIIQK